MKGPARTFNAISQAHVSNEMITIEKAFQTIIHKNDERYKEMGKIRQDAITELQKKIKVFTEMNQEK